MLSRATGTRTVVAGFLLYGALFTDRLAPLFLADRIGDAFGVDAAALGLLPLAIAVGWTLGLAAARLVGTRMSLRQRVLVGGMITALAGLASALAPGFTAFLVVRLLGGIGANLTSPALIALVVRAAPGHRRGAALGLVQSSTRIAGSFLAPIVLTAVVATAGWQPAIAVAASTLVVALVASAGLLPARIGPAGAPARSQPPVYRQGGSRLIGVAAATAALTLLWLVLISQGGVPLLEDWLELDVAAAGRLLAWFGIGSTVAAVVVPSWSDRSRAAALAVASLASALAGLLLGIAVLSGARPPLALVGLGIAIAGIGLGALPMAISILPADAVAEGDVDRAVEIPIIFAELVGGALLPAVAFAIVARVGLAPVLVATSVAFMLLAVVGAPMLARTLRVNAGR